ncbi:MAG: lipid-binding SYLF domain-containing protein [Pseudomonadota bacterium]
MTIRLLTILTALAVAIGLAVSPAAAKSKREKAEALVAEASETVAYFTDDSAYEALWELAPDAKAMVIMPKSWRGGFIFGGAGGNAVMVARTDEGGWSEPTFFTIGTLSFGLQAGMESSEIILLVMTQRGMEQLLSTSVKLGGDLSLAAGPVGGGAKAQTVDVLAFARSRGLYGGMSLEGSILKARHSWNREYYGADVSPADIIYRGKAARPHSTLLQSAAWSLAHRMAPANLAPLQIGDAPEDTVYEDDEFYGAPLN